MFTKTLLTIALLLGGQVDDSLIDGPDAEKKAEPPNAAQDGNVPGENASPPPEGESATGDPDQPADGEGTPPDGDEVTEPDAASEGNEEKTEFDKFMESGVIGLLMKGGGFMWPILILGIIAAGVIIERFRSLKMLSTDTVELRSEVKELLHEDNVEDALKRCDQEKGPVPAILSAGLRKYLVLRKLKYDRGRIEEQVVKAMDDYSVHVVAALERHLPILATIASVAPMLGFLGTVAGMIVSFDEIDMKFGTDNIVKLAAGGIKVSLLTTAFGLIIGIPAFMAFNYFSSLINRFVLDVEETATELIEAVTLQSALEELHGPEATGSTEGIPEIEPTVVGE